MPPLPYSIELHDSVVTAATVLDESLIIEFAPAYVHRDGKGWIQNARLILATLRATGQSVTVELLGASTFVEDYGPY